jgi:hypothetical protein
MQLSDKLVYKILHYYIKPKDFFSAIQIYKKNTTCNMSDFGLEGQFFGFQTEYELISIIQIIK